MARLAVLASGNGSNFEALVLAARDAGHQAVLLICDKPGAYCLERAERLEVPARLIQYGGRPRAQAEADIMAALEDAGADLVALAGFMRLLGRPVIERWRGRILNVHPSLLPAWAGVDSIRRAYEAGDPVLGVTVHQVDEGMDTGPVLGQERVGRAATLAETESLIHQAEHRLYARLVVELLDEVD